MNRYMRKPYRCSVCFRSFDTIEQAEAHWFGTHAASADTRPEGGDALAAPFTSGAVPEGQTPRGSRSSTSQEGSN